MVSDTTGALVASRRTVRRRSLAAAIGLAVMLVWMAVELRALHTARGVNAAIARDSLAELAQSESPRGRLAAAYLAHRDGRLDEALAAYGEVGGQRDPRFRSVLRFNLGNLYLARAAAFEARGEKQLSISLVEQAKENYRDLLRRDPGNWDARHNLSRALEMLPDLPDVQYGDEVNPERSPQAPKSDSVHERLP